MFRLIFMFHLIFMMLRSLLTGLRTQATMQAEILAIRHQLVVLQRTHKKTYTPGRHLFQEFGFWIGSARGRAIDQSDVTISEPPAH